MRAHLSIVLLAAGCTTSDPSLDITYDPCEPIAIAIAGATDDQVAGVGDATALWRARGVTAFDPADAGTPIEIRFEPAAGAFHGYYDDELGIVYVNAGLHDAASLAVVVAHELGHAFGLLHVDPRERTSVMNRGNLATEPTEDDRAALATLWGDCGPR